MFHAVFGTPLAWVVMLAPLGFVVVLSFGINRLIPVRDPGDLLALRRRHGPVDLLHLRGLHRRIDRPRVLHHRGTFGALSLYGYTTKRDLTGFGSFLIMGLFGIIIAMVVNIFLHSSALQFAVSVLGVLIFAGLTAYDTQRIKSMYWEADGAELAGKKAIMGALALYLDFINMMMLLMQFLGNRR